MTSARTSKVPVTETGASIAAKAMPSVTAVMTVLPAKAVTAVGLPVNTVMTRADMNADAGMDRFRLEGHRYRQRNHEQAGSGRKTFDWGFHGAHARSFSSLAGIVPGDG